MSTNTSLFYVEHRVTNKQEWDDINSNYFKIMAAEDMTIDKGNLYIVCTSHSFHSPNLSYYMHIIGLKHPDLEGDNWGILSCSDLTGTFTVCVWQVPSHMTKQSFQEFIDRFSQGTAVNNVYSVQNTLGNRLSPRKFMRCLLSTEFVHIICSNSDLLYCRQVCICKISSMLHVTSPEYHSLIENNSGLFITTFKTSKDGKPTLIK